MGRAVQRSLPVRRRALAVVAAGVLAAVAATLPVASAAKLRLSVKPDQPSSALAVTVVATGTADGNPTRCPLGIGCELTVFVLRSGACPAKPTARLINDPFIVDFLTSRGLPSLIGTTPGSFSASGDFFLDGAPNARTQGSAVEGYTQSRWGRFIFCGYLQDARARTTFTNPQPDELDLLGHAEVRQRARRIDVYSVLCAAPPCHIRLTERAYAAGRHVPALDDQSLSPLLQSAATYDGSYAVAFREGAAFRALLKSAIARHGSVVLHFTGTVIDARGGRAEAARTIIVRD